VTPRAVAVNALLVLVATTGWFITSTSLVGSVPPAASIAVATLVGAAAVFGLTRTRVPLRGLVAPEALPAVAAGAVAFGLAPLMVAANRFSDAPPGSEVLFLTTACWAVITIVLAWAVSVRTRPALHLAGAAAILIGAASIASNLERPSSFSPFVRYPDQDTAFLLAGVAFAAGLLVLGRAARVRGAEETARSAAVGAALMGAVGWVLSRTGGFEQIAESTIVLALAGFALGGLLVGLVRLAADRGAPRAVVWMGLAPAALVLVSPVERGFAPLGPTPILWGGVAAGVAVLAAGSAVVWLAPPLPERRLSVAGSASDGGTPRGRIALLVCGGALLLTGLWMLAAPSMSATATGVLDSGDVYRATWDMLGAETPLAWLAVVAGAALLAAWADVARGLTWRHTAMIAAGLALVCLLAIPFLRTTPLRTWTRWVPTDIQQAYGTEYARFLAAPVPVPRAVTGFPRPADARIRMGADIEYVPPTTPSDAGPVQSLMRFAPDDLPGWTAQEAQALSANSLSRSYSAADGSGLTIAVEQYRSSETAKEAVQAALATFGSVSERRIGRLTVFIAEDSQGVAAAGWASGTVGIVAEVVAPTPERASEALEATLLNLAD